MFSTNTNTLRLTVISMLLNVVFVLTTQAYCEEIKELNMRIESSNSVIEVLPNGDTVVEEEMVFLIEGRKPKELERGLPLFWQDSNKNLHKMKYYLLSLKVNDREVTQAFKNNFKNTISFSTKQKDIDAVLSEKDFKGGVYRVKFYLKYAIENAINHQHPEYHSLDSLFTFDSWDNPVDKAKVTLILPNGSKMLAYRTGDDGNIKRTPFTLNKDEAGNYVFESKEALGRGNGFKLGLDFKSAAIKAVNPEPYMSYSQAMFRFWAFVAIWVTFLVAICYVGRNKRR